MYSFWDLSGDIGGLVEILKTFGGLLISFLTIFNGSNLDKYLISQLFFLESKSETKAKRKHAKFESPLCLLKRKPQKFSMYSKGLSRIDKELDLVEFIRHQLIDKISMNLLFTRSESYLMKHQYKPFVLSSNDQVESDNSDDVDHHEMRAETRFKQKLIENIRAKQSKPP